MLQLRWCFSFKSQLLTQFFFCQGKNWNFPTIILPWMIFVCAFLHSHLQRGCPSLNRRCHPHVLLVVSSIYCNAMHLSSLLFPPALDAPLTMTDTAETKHLSNLRTTLKLNWHWVAAWALKNQRKRRRSRKCSQVSFHDDCCLFVAQQLIFVFVIFSGNLPLKKSCTI